MSGGSYNYLCYKDIDEYFYAQEDLEAMKNRLAALGAPIASAKTAEFIKFIDNLRDEFEKHQKELKEIWHAVEWYDSGDYGLDTTKNILKEFEDANQTTETTKSC